VNADTNADLEHVVIVGAGFAGLNCAKALGGAPLRVTLIDRNNYHLFVPLLYQVATAALSPADIAEPIRKVMSRYPNISVMMGELLAIDRDRRHIKLQDGSCILYDRLVLATGSKYNYFGHREWEAVAPGPRTIADARALRSRLLRAFEQAEHEKDPKRQQALMTILVVGGGPTGVEMAGAIAELSRFTLARNFRRIDPASARILLVEAGERILAGFPPQLSAYATARLARMGVEVLTSHRVDALSEGQATINGEQISVATIVWGAGIKASPVAAWLDVKGDRLGRVQVNPDLSVPGIEDVYIIGDSALCTDHTNGHPLPALAQVAQQQGYHLGRAIAGQSRTGAPLPDFQFRNRGNTAVIGRNAAVFDFGKRLMKGFPAWILWAIVHVYLLIGFDKRVKVSLQWLWRYFTYQRGARIISDTAPPASRPIAAVDRPSD